MVAILPIVLITGLTLRGRVIDDVTGEPLYYAQVVLDEIKRGVTTDPSGIFEIRDIPPGEYTLSVYYLGYETYKRTLVLKGERSPYLVIRLKKTLLYLEKEIEVTATPLHFRKDVTPSVYSIPGNEILTKPVDNYEDIIKIQPGVAAGHIRGGRLGEVLYLVDGVPIVEPIFGGPATDLPNNAIVEMTVYTGGFEAEYGNAMSGVVNLVTKKRVEKPGGFLVFQTDIPGRPLPSRDITSYESKFQFEGSYGGHLKRRFFYFLSVDYERTDTRFHDYFRRLFRSPIDENFNFTGNLTYDFAPNTSLTLQGLSTFWRGRIYEHRWKYNLEGLPPRKRGSYRIGLHWSHAPFSGFFYNIKLHSYWVLAQVLGKDARKYDPSIEFDSLGYVISGDKPWWQDHEEVILSFKTDFNFLIKNIHSIKAGGEFIYYDLYLNNVLYKDISQTQPQNPNPYYIAYVTEYNYYPHSGAFFVQDKIRFPNMTMDLGIRYDFLDPRATRPAVERSPLENEEDWIIKVKERVPASVKHQISPRFGMAFQASDRDVIRINYGHFFQMPLFQYLYTNIDYDLTAGYPPLVGDPDLKASKTVAYEIGWKHWIDDTKLLSFTVFSKDVSNLVDTKRYLPDTAETLAPVEGGYTKFANIGLATVYGMEVLLQKIKGEKWSGSLSYTFMVARGTIGAFGLTREEDIAYWEGVRVAPGEFYYLSWDQRHTLVGELIIGNRERGFLDILLRWNSPLPYTREGGEPNGERMKSTLYWDIKALYPIPVKYGRLSLIFEMRNIPDKRNLLWVDAYGQPGGRLKDPTAWDEGRRVLLGFWLDF
jgi:outer membrane receptor protein involved in Fe transport